MRIAFSIIGILVSIAVIITGIILCDEYVSTYVMSAEFGADFYTYIYDATRKVAILSGETATAVYHGFGYLLIGIGSIAFCAFGVSLSPTKPKVIVMPPVAQVSSPVNSEIAYKNDHSDYPNS